MYHQQTRKNICKARIANIKPLLIWQDFCNLENSSDICTNIEFKEIVQKLYCYYLWLMQFYKISSFDWLIVVCKPSNFKLLIHNFKWQTTRGEFFLKIRTDFRLKTDGQSNLYRLLRNWNTFRKLYLWVQALFAPVKISAELPGMLNNCTYVCDHGWAWNWCLMTNFSI